MSKIPVQNIISSADSSINTYQSISYVLPYIAVYMLMVPMNIIQGIYAKHYGLALTTLATIILLSRIFDAVSDPVIGYFSDRYRTKQGTRKPFVIAGSLMVILSGYFLYMPKADVTPFYAGFWIIAFYLSFTVFEIPHVTWPCDIAKSSRDKTKLYSFRTFGGYCGLSLFYCIPLLPLFDSNAITPETLKVTYIVVAIFTLPFLFQAMRAVPNGAPVVAKNRDAVRFFSWRVFKLEVKGISKNKPFLIFVLAFVLGGFATGMWYGLIFIYVDVYLKMGDQFAEMFLIAFIVGLLMTPVWYQLALKTGKKWSWLLAMGLLMISFIFTGMLEPETTTFAQLLTLKILQTSGFVCLNIVTPAMLSEIIDYAHWKTGLDQSGTYFSLRVFFEKANLAAGMALGLAIAGWWGFNATALEHTEDSIAGLKLAISGIPSVIGFLSLVFVVLSPISERRHTVLRRRIDTRLARAKVMSPSPDIEQSAPSIKQ